MKHIFVVIKPQLEKECFGEKNGAALERETDHQIVLAEDVSYSDTPFYTPFLIFE